MQTTTIANAVFLFAASPLLATVLGWAVLGERVGATTWAAIGLAGVGMFLMVREGLSLGAGLGNLMAILSALGFAIFTLVLRWRRLPDMLPAVLWGGILSLAVAGAVVAARGTGLAVPPRDLAVAVALGAVVLALGLWLYTIGARVLPAADLTLLAMIEVVLAPIWVWAAFGERASPGTFAGGAVLLAALVLNALGPSRRRRMV